jgi:hypothetical protein
MRMISIRDRIEPIIEAEFGKVCAENDEVWWACGPDSMSEITEDDDGDACLSSVPHWAVQVIITNPDEELKANVYMAFELSVITNMEALTKQLRDVASDLAFQRQVYDVDSEDVD